MLPLRTQNECLFVAADYLQIERSPVTFKGHRLPGTDMPEKFLNFSYPIRSKILSKAFGEDFRSSRSQMTIPNPRLRWNAIQGFKLYEDVSTRMG